MTPYELEVAAYAAAHKIYSGLPAPDRPCPGGYRSRMIDQIAETIKQAFKTDPGLASSYRESSPADATVRPGAVSEENREWRFWMQMPHIADIRVGGFVCLRCGLLESAEVHELDRRVAAHTQFLEHFDQAWSQLQDVCLPKPLLVERAEFDVERAAD